MSGGLQDRVASGELLPTADRYVDVEGIDFDAIGASADLFRGKDGRAGSHERIEHDVPTTRAVTHGVGNQGDWLYRGMDGQFCETVFAKRIDAGVLPDVRPRSTVLAEFNVVLMGCVPVLENKN